MGQVEDDLQVKQAALMREGSFEVPNNCEQSDLHLQSSYGIFYRTLKIGLSIMEL